MEMRYLFVLIVGARDVAPLLDDASQVHRVEWNLHLSDLIVFGEAVEVVDGEHQCLWAHFSKRHLKTTQQRY